MPRIVDFTMDGMNGATLKLSSMSWAQAEKFVEAGQELLARGKDVKASEWLDRTLITVSQSLIFAGCSSADASAEKIKESFDMPTINAMYFRILELSGLKATQGEAPAA